MERGFKYLIDKYRIEGARAKFEELMTVLLKEIYDGKAYNIRTSRGDGGVDIYVGDINNSPDIYQCKFFDDGLNDSRKQQIKKSLNKALENHIINRWILCVPCQFSHQEHEWWCKFKKNFESGNVQSIELYDEIQIISMLKKNGWYEEFFDAVRIDKPDAKKIFNEIETAKIAIDVNYNEQLISKDETEIVENITDSAYVYNSCHMDFFGFLPQFPNSIEGSCSIEFKRNKLRDMIVTLDHKQILSLFELILMNNDDYFFSEEFAFKDKIKFFIGNIVILLTREELTELISILRNYNSHYIEKLKKITNYLEIEKFEVSRELNLGYRLFKIKIELWNAMKKFANKHDYLKGKSNWHIFNPNGYAINVYTSVHNKSYIPNRHAYFNIEKTDEINDNFVWLVLNLEMTKDRDTKLDQYNKRNIWGALTAYKWCIEEFIPKVAKEYMIFHINDFIDNYNIKYMLNKKKEDYISDLQMFYLSNRVDVDETYLEDAKQSLIYCLSKKELPLNDYGYIIGKLSLREEVSMNGKEPHEIAESIIKYLKQRNHAIKKWGNKNSQVDHYLRCILAFVDDRSNNRLCNNEFDILVKHLAPLIEKMNDIEFIRKYYKIQ